jgi:7-cyano-7-deazaguanine synthase
MVFSYKNDDALVLVSGGQDSTTCLFWAKKNFKKIYAVSFNYGQKHSNEINIAAKICDKLNVSHKVIDITFISNIVESNLFIGKDNVNKKHKLNKNVPSSFVPYRNLLFLSLAAAWASTLKIRHLVIGVCETDYSGYADCRDVFIKSMQASLNLATDFKEKVVIHTPLMWLTKAETFKFAEELGCLDFIIEETLTCYNGSEKINNYGKGCGKCPACRIRKKGYEDFLRKYRR